MSFPCCFLSRIWRRKPQIFVGLLLFLGTVLICSYNIREKEPQSVYSQRWFGAAKRLQQVQENSFEPVQFIPGVPGSHHRKMPVAPPNHVGSNPAEEFRIHKGLYESNNRPKKSLEILADRRVKFHPLKLQEGKPEKKPQQEGHQQVSLEAADSSPQLGLPRAQMESSNTPVYVPPHRIVHLDLKGAPPSIAYLKRVIGLSARLGATGVLLEWEDMFPWSGRLRSVAANNHYTLAEVNDLLKACQSFGLEVIPLVQTFGHMEFILKHERFSYLRDVEEMPESICPCHNDTMGVVREIVDQVMAVHKKSKYLHIGCDEVFHLGECRQCNGSGRSSLFVNHVTKLAEYVNKSHNVQTIIWDDMLRNLFFDDLLPLSKLVEPMVWVYAEDVYRFVPSYTWDRYSMAFDYIWTASAFKGAHGETLVVPDVQRHLQNNLNWLALMAEEQPKLRGGFRGIALTGWQRYDHFAVLCELLPAAIPSLAVNLISTSNGFFNETLGKPLFKALGCVQHSGKYNSFVDLERDNFLWEKLNWCFFPGANFFKMTKTLVNTEKEVDEFLDKLDTKKGWLTPYNIRHNLSSPFRIDEALEDASRIESLVTSLMMSANSALSEMFDRYTVAEWIEQKLYPMHSKLLAHRREAQRVRTVRSWPARPFQPLEELKVLGIGIVPTFEPVVADTGRPKRRVQAPDYYSSRRRGN